MWLIEEIVGSYASSSSTIFENKGVPIGNLTSQLFANVYMNQFDQFVKQALKVKHYARYTDDFVVVATDQTYLEGILPDIGGFLSQQLALNPHPKKIGIHKFHRGVDFLGYITFPHHRLVRTKTKRRIVAGLERRIRDYHSGKITKISLEQSFQSYLGVLSHADARKLSENLKNEFWLQVG